MSSSKKQKVEDKLINDRFFRERSNKNRGIVELLIAEYSELENIDKHLLITICKKFTSMDRDWRWLTEHYKEYRGSDYGDKKVLEQEKQIELEYTPGHYKDLKQSKLL